MVKKSNLLFISSLLLIVVVIVFTSFAVRSLEDIFNIILACFNSNKGFYMQLFASIPFISLLTGLIGVIFSKLNKLAIIPVIFGFLGIFLSIYEIFGLLFFFSYHEIVGMNQLDVIIRDILLYSKLLLRVLYLIVAFKLMKQQKTIK